MRYILISAFVLSMTATAHVVKSNRAGIYNKHVSDQVTESKSAVKKRQKKAKREVKKQIRREKLESIENGTTIGTGTL